MDQADFRGYRPISKVAQTPPLGWNSWDVFGTSVTEAEVRAQAAAMAESLAPSGYRYITIDLGWYAPGSTAVAEQYKRPRPHQVIDGYGRLIPDPERFPSSRGGRGFKPLADHLHGMGLKLGIHVMRGIPIQAVDQDTPILGATTTARRIMKHEDRCVFYDGMYAVDLRQEGSLAYYRSLLDLYAEWGVDLIKADDMTSWPQHYDEVYAFRYALDQCGRPMVLSLSPGACGYMERSFLNQTGDMFRITGDLWDTWEALKGSFATCRTFKGHTGPGSWADCDMVPIGIINIRGEAGHGERQDRFTPDERQTLMTLWSIFRSPLMLGCDLTRLDSGTRNLFTNPDLLRINQASVDNDEVSHGPHHSVWTARDPQGHQRWIALFNLSDAVQTIEADMPNRDSDQPTRVTDVWSGTGMSIQGSRLRLEVAPHGVRLLRLA